MAIQTIRLPDVGEGVTEAELSEILVKTGDLVREDDPIAAVMTDKATVEITSAFSGRVVWIGGEVGQTLAIGSDLFRIEEDVAAVAQAPEPQADSRLVEPVADLEDIPPPVSPPAGVDTVLAPPAVRARASDLGIDLHAVRGSGPEGRITHADLDSLLGARPQQLPADPVEPSRRPDADSVVKVTGLRRMIARRMSEANASIPHITVVEEVDVTDLELLRSKLNETRGDRAKLTLLPLVTAALVKAKESCPTIFARYDDEAEEVHYTSAVHIGIATMTEAGLMVPVLRNAQDADLFGLAADIARLSAACRAGTAKREELTGSTMTISSLGALGALATTPIINKPEVAILGLNRMAVRPSWNGTSFVPRTMMNISASFDHRIIDGWDAAVFVARMKALMETPALIFVKA